MSTETNTTNPWNTDIPTVPLMRGVDRQDVEVDTDGAHRGPPQFRETEDTVTDSTGLAHPVVGMFCPCGHFIREISAAYIGTPELETVECEGELP